MKTKVEILREYPVGRRTYRVGEVIEVPADVADRMTKTRPPYAKRAAEPKAEAPKAEAPAKGKDAGAK